MPIAKAYGAFETEPEEKGKKKRVMLVSGGEPLSRNKGKAKTKAKSLKIPRKRNPATLAKPGSGKAKKELTADEAFMQAWEYSYKNRHKRVA